LKEAPLTTVHQDDGTRADGGIDHPADPSRATGTARLAAMGGILGALAASSCCILPLVLFSVGVSGAWIGNLAALAPYQPYIIALTLAFLGAGFVMVYRRPRMAADGATCARPMVGRVTKPALWTATAMVAAAAVFPYVAPWMLGLN
jgi:mercuric ion transport protein